MTVNDWLKSRVGAYKEKPSVCIMHIYTLTAGSLNMAPTWKWVLTWNTQYKLDSGVDDTLCTHSNAREIGN